MSVKIEAARAVLNCTLSGKEHSVQRNMLRSLKSEPRLSPVHLPSTLPEERHHVEPTDHHT